MQVDEPVGHPLKDGVSILAPVLHPLGFLHEILAPAQRNHGPPGYAVHPLALAKISLPIRASLVYGAPPLLWHSPS
jgi:hypothetical protein